MVLEMCDVRAIGLKSFSSLGCGFFGTGMRQDVFHRVGTFPSWRLRLKRCCRGSPSSTAHISKTMERLLLHILRPQVRHALDPLQFAYQEKVGVEDAIVYLRGLQPFSARSE